MYGIYLPPLSTTISSGSPSLSTFIILQIILARLVIALIQESLRAMGRNGPCVSTQVGTAHLMKGRYHYTSTIAQEGARLQPSRQRLLTSMAILLKQDVQLMTDTLIAVTGTQAGVILSSYQISWTNQKIFSIVMVL